jgi:outer membrane protein assembly factor BamB
MVEDGSRLQGLDPASGKARWQRDMPPHLGRQIVGDTVLLTAADGTVTGVDSASGTTRWTQRLKGRTAPYFVSFAGDPLAYTTDVPGDGTSKVTAIAPKTGAVRWEARLQGDLKPVGSHDGTLYLLATDQRYGDVSAVVRYDPTSGSVDRVELPARRQDPRVGVHGDVVHLLTAGGSLEAVDMEAGRRIWVLETSVSRGSAPVADGRHVYFSAPDGRLLAVDARGGKLRGETPPRLGPASDGVPAYLPEPVVEGDRVYASAPDGTVFSVPARDPAAW